MKEKHRGAFSFEVKQIIYYLKKECRPIGGKSLECTLLQYSPDSRQINHPIMACTFNLFLTTVTTSLSLGLVMGQEGDDTQARSILSYEC